MVAGVAGGFLEGQRIQADTGARVAQTAAQELETSMKKKSYEEAEKDKQDRIKGYEDFSKKWDTEHQAPEGAST